MRVRFSTSWLARSLLLLATGVVAGCGPQGTHPVGGPVARNGDQGGTADNDAADSEGAAAGEDSEITLKVVDAEGYKQVIAQHQGKVVLVDFWATWCTHCVEQFPHTVKLHERHGDEGLAVVSVSFDDEADKQQALKMLRKFGATFDNLLSQYGGGLESMEAFQIDGGLPFYRLYDREGELRHTFADTDPDKPLSTDDIDVKVSELLAEN
jgi:thiol-disulfide isomerase/thioredoxin